MLPDWKLNWKMYCCKMGLKNLWFIQINLEILQLTLMIVVQPQFLLLMAVKFVTQHISFITFSLTNFLIRSTSFSFFYCTLFIHPSLCWPTLLRVSQLFIWKLLGRGKYNTFACDGVYSSVRKKKHTNPPT